MIRTSEGNQPTHQEIWRQMDAAIREYNRLEAEPAYAGFQIDVQIEALERVWDAIIEAYNLSEQPGQRMEEIVQDHWEANRRIRFMQKTLQAVEKLKSSLLPSRLRDLNLKEVLPQKLRELDRIEHSIYARYDSMLPVQQEVLRNLLLTLQRTHADLVDRTIKADAPLWVDNREWMEEGELTEIDKLWTEIVDESAFPFTDTIPSYTKEETGSAPFEAEIPAEFRHEMRAGLLSSLARLMSRPGGRSLLQHLKGDVRFGLVPLLEAQMLNATMRAGADDREAEKPQLVENRLQPGPGSTTEVQIIPYESDVDFTIPGKDKKPVLAPHFINLGHELIHAAHARAGITISRAHPHDRADQLPKSYQSGWGQQVEEFLTVEPPEARHPFRETPIQWDGGTVPLGDLFARNRFRGTTNPIPTEATLRREHGLSTREGYYPPDYQDAARNRTLRRLEGLRTLSEDWDRRAP